MRNAACGVLAVVAALLSGNGLAPAQDPAGARPDEPQGLQILAEIQPRYLATLALGSSSQPQVGPYQALALLRLGEHPRIQAWTIENPLSNPNVRALLGAGTLLASGTPLTELALLKAGDRFDCWTLINTDEVRRLPGILLQRVRDEKPIPGPLANDPELDVYFQMLVFAGQTSDKAFRQAARRDISYRHLFEDPRKYRGEVVAVEGKLRRLDRFDAPQLLRQAGFPDLYEAWIFSEGLGANPVCVLFTELAPGLEVGDKLEVPVSVAGYFYKKYRYVPGDNFQRNLRRDAPLLIARTLRRLSPLPAAEDANWGKGMLPLFLGLLITTVGIVLVLALWFRHNDQRVRRRLAVVQKQDFVLPIPEEEIPLADPVTNPHPYTTENGVGPLPPQPGESLLRPDRPGW